MACFSHLPHVLANLLVEQASARVAGALDAGERLPAAGPSFRDATRVAGANTAIWTDIYLANRDALIPEIDEAIARLGEVRELLARRRRRGDRRMERPRPHAREELLGAGLAGRAGRTSCASSVPNRPGVLAEIALALGRAGVNIVDMALSPSQTTARVIALWLRGAEHALTRRAADRRAGLPGRARPRGAHG